MERVTLETETDDAERIAENLEMVAHSIREGYTSGSVGDEGTWQWRTEEGE